MCHMLCIAQDHSFLNFLLWISWFLFDFFFCFVWFFQAQTQGNFCTHGCYRCRQCMDCHDAEFLKWLLFIFVWLLNFFEESLQYGYKNKFCGFINIPFFFTILAFKNIIYISKMKIGFALIFWEILSTLVLSSFSSEQIKIYLLFSLTI